MATTATDARRAELAAALAREEEKLLACVHCGFCLQACPTYTRLGDEADSPRGRLYLMRAVAEGRLEPDADAFATHIDRCLGCRACETVCPSGVEYGHLLEYARSVIARERGTGLAARALLAVFGRRRLSRFALAVGRALRATGLPRGLAHRLPRRLHAARFGLAMLAATRGWPGLRSVGARPHTPPASNAAPAAPAARGGAPHAGAAPGPPARGAAPEPGWPGRTSTRSSARTSPPAARGPADRAAHAPRLRVAILTGCVQDGLFRRVNEATRRVLKANGCDVVVVPRQGCCGALHAHGGDRERARALARANIDAFERAGVDVVAVNAAGCGAALKEYGALLADDPVHAERARAFAARVRDVFELLVELGPRAGAPLPLRVTYDAPCHLHHAQRITRAPLDVLAAIPGLELVPLPGADECCGGAGIYGLTHPEPGGRILADKVAAVRATGADAVVTPNPGCIMQIGAGLLLEGDDRPVLHPIELLDESYRRLPPEPDA
ncbi:MAG TPA: heterodisulfide reductase-related iron-sulfur binding cluster [Longimicrobiales bacterium]